MIERKPKELYENDPKVFLDGRVFVGKHGLELTEFGSALQAVFLRLDQLNIENGRSRAASQELTVDTIGLCIQWHLPHDDPQALKGLRMELMRLVQERNTSL